jgi:MYXO-CTERM domain-containing protein
MAAALSTGGVLDGGDWNEGWQYGPLAVAEYALAARVARAAGIAVEGVPAWLASMLRRHVHALSPSDRMWVGGDFDSERAYTSASPLTLDAIALGDAQPEDQQWAKAELARIKETDQNYLLYDALAQVGEPAKRVPREAWPTWYQARSSATVFARTSWDDQAIWFVASCASMSGVDHRSPNAGNFVLSRGAADLIVDPTPYGSLSTLTGNAPTVASAQLPPKYIPSQGAWGEDIAWRWATQTRTGVVAARCDYADAFRFQERKTDVAEALRDLVLLPSADGHDAALVVVDRATTGEAARKMYLRFRVPAELALDASGTASATIQDARLAIHGAHAPTLGKPAQKDCFKDGTERGKCDAARFPVTDYRAEIAGPAPRAVHVITATGTRTTASSKEISGEGWTGVRIAGTRDAVVVWPSKRGGELTYAAPRGPAVTHVVLDAPEAGGTARVTARADGASCVVTVTPGGVLSARPVIVTLDDGCAVAPDPEAKGAPIDGKPAAVRSKPRAHRGGCCGAERAPGSPLAMSVVVLALLWRRRRR